MPDETNQTSFITEIVTPLLGRLPSLYPTEEWDERIDLKIERMLLESLITGRIDQKPYALAVKSGLHLLNESLDKSHTISREILNASGSYWHGIMHRMEGDYSNAKYWFHQVGNHPIDHQLASKVQAYLSEQETPTVTHTVLRSKLEDLAVSPVWNAAIFVDAVELQVTRVQNPAVEMWLRQIQGFEMKLLLEYCYEQSCGGTLLEVN